MAINKKIAVICARGGSKGVLKKNVKIIAGKPLIAHTITQALSSKCFDLVLVSSDDDEILEISKKFGAHPLKRPAELANDNAGAIPALLHALTAIEAELKTSFDFICLLQPTSPLRSIIDIQAALLQLQESTSGNIFSVCEAKASPYYTLVEKDNNGNISLSKPSNAIRRQDLPNVYEINGAIYAWKREAFLSNQQTIRQNSEIYIMPHERSLDIDTEFDFELCRLVMENKK